jgi:hypothetical protein
MNQIRPIGITLIAILNFVFAGLMIPRIVVVLNYPFRNWSFPLFGWKIFADPVDFVADGNRGFVLFLVIVQLVVYLILAVGILKLNECARQLVILNSILSIILSISRNFLTPVPGSTLLECLILAFVISYLTRSSVCKIFNY